MAVKAKHRTRESLQMFENLCYFVLIWSNIYSYFNMLNIIRSLEQGWATLSSTNDLRVNNVEVYGLNYHCDVISVLPSVFEIRAFL